MINDEDIQRERGENHGTWLKRRRKVEEEEEKRREKIRHLWRRGKCAQLGTGKGNAGKGWWGGRGNSA